jgi:hypothetical protein
VTDVTIAAAVPTVKAELKHILMENRRFAGPGKSRLLPGQPGK